MTLGAGNEVTIRRFLRSRFIGAIGQRSDCLESFREK